ncbi:cysteine--tRNA ligase [Mesorhizobium sp. L-8-10]|uniref:cysteine--tRNA ligase n=1 Tax=Mesorhizobium sp. L-8-10 TaxID=2744523 RepID=UPI001927A1DE|nr:cysteine--tRNA ligase [Mesorhizobium sp. L-8-10]BCH33848.1 cysteine--tRNA ligase [Mesorhizobium sp. L-8-10]
MSEASTGLRLYNTLTRAKEDFAPIDVRNVRLYVCGPTVYDFAHIGNARPVIVFDVLFRLLRHLYGADHVTYVRNITDVDDKINARAARDFPGLPLNEAIRQVTEKTARQFHEDVAALNCLPPTHEPRATEHIAEMRAMIERLVARGVAYVAEDHVLFSPSEMNRRSGPRYGALAKRSLDEMLAGARVDVASYKRDEMDFVLWKPSRPGEPGWPSPAGIEVDGRPGWHIECSAMSMAKLLEPFGGGLQCDDPLKNTFDIHAGGIDLVFPHHENEIAQSCCAFGSERMANVWMHNGFLQVEGQKMSKSLGNFVTINELLRTDTFGGRRWPGEVLRLAMLTTHYRQPIDFTANALMEAERTLDGWYRAVGDVDAGDVSCAETVDALLDDLNTSKAIAGLHELRAEASKGSLGAKQALKRSAALLGLLGQTESAWTAGKAANAGVDRQAIEAQIATRLAHIAAKDWPAADRVRDELLAQGIQLKDGKDPATGARVTTWEMKR